MRQSRERHCLNISLINKCQNIREIISLNWNTSFDKNGQHLLSTLKTTIPDYIMCHSTSLVLFSKHLFDFDFVLFYFY